MTTETDAPPSAESGEPVEGNPALEPARVDPAKEALWTRLILPLLLPLLSAAAVVLWTVNLSRAFLAGGSEGALVIVVVVTVTIVAGAAALSAAPRLATSTKILLVSALLVLVVSAGLVSLGPSEEKAKAGGGGFQEPKGPAVATVEVDALPSLTFQAKEFTTQAGINQINYIDKGGNHTLVFDDPKLAGFGLKVPPDDSGKVDLKPGKYVIYCTIPGHRAAGMQATLIVQ